MILESGDLREYISKNQIQAELVYLSVETPTVTAAAKALNVSTGQICKSLVFVVEKLPVMIIGSGKAPISYPLLAELLEVNRRRLKIATPEEVITFTGYRVGTVPPFGHTTSLPTYIDSGILAKPIVYAGGGSIDTLLKLEPAELLRASKGTTADLQGS